MSIATHHPRAYATVTGPTATFVSPGGRREPVTATGDEDIRQAVLRRATDEARGTGTPVELVTSDDRGTHHLLVGTDGAPAPIATEPPTHITTDPLDIERTSTRLNTSHSHA